MSQIIAIMLIGYSLFQLLGCPIGTGPIRTVIFPQLIPWLNTGVGVGFIFAQFMVVVWYRNRKMAITLFFILLGAIFLVWFGTLLYGGAEAVLGRYNISLHRHLLVTGSSISGIVLGAGILKNWWAFRRNGG